MCAGTWQLLELDGSRIAGTGPSRFQAFWIRKSTPGARNVPRSASPGGGACRRRWPQRGKATPESRKNSSSPRRMHDFGKLKECLGPSKFLSARVELSRFKKGPHKYPKLPHKSRTAHIKCSEAMEYRWFEYVRREASKKKNQSEEIGSNVAMTKTLESDTIILTDTRPLSVDPEGNLVRGKPDGDPVKRGVRGINQWWTAYHSRLPQLNLFPTL